MSHALKRIIATRRIYLLCCGRPYDFKFNHIRQITTSSRETLGPATTTAPGAPLTAPWSTVTRIPLPTPLENLLEETWNDIQSSGRWRKIKHIQRYLNLLLKSKGIDHVDVTVLLKLWNMLTEMKLPVLVEKLTEYSELCVNSFQVPYSCQEMGILSFSDPHRVFEFFMEENSSDLDRYTLALELLIKYLTSNDLKELVYFTKAVRRRCIVLPGDWPLIIIMTKLVQRNLPSDAYELFLAQSTLNVDVFLDDRILFLVIGALMQPTMLQSTGGLDRIISFITEAMPHNKTGALSCLDNVLKELYQNNCMTEITKLHVRDIPLTFSQMEIIKHAFSMLPRNPTDFTTIGRTALLPQEKGTESHRQMVTRLFLLRDQNALMNCMKRRLRAGEEMNNLDYQSVFTTVKSKKHHTRVLQFCSTARDRSDLTLKSVTCAIQYLIQNEEMQKVYDTVQAQSVLYKNPLELFQNNGLIYSILTALLHEKMITNTDGSRKLAEFVEQVFCHNEKGARSLLKRTIKHLSREKHYEAIVTLHRLAQDLPYSVWQMLSIQHAYRKMEEPDIVFQEEIANLENVVMVESERHRLLVQRYRVQEDEDGLVAYLDTVIQAGQELTFADYDAVFNTVKSGRHQEAMLNYFDEALYLPNFRMKRYDYIKYLYQLWLSDNVEECTNVFALFFQRGNVATMSCYTLLINMAYQEEGLSGAFEVFQELKEDLAPSIEVYNLMMTLALQSEEIKIACKIYHQILSHSEILPDLRTFKIAYKVAKELDDICFVDKIQADVLRVGIETQFLCGAHILCYIHTGLYNEIDDELSHMQQTFGFNDDVLRALLAKLVFARNPDHVERIWFYWTCIEDPSRVPRPTLNRLCRYLYDMNERHKLNEFVNYLEECNIQLTIPKAQMSQITIEDDGNN